MLAIFDLDGTLTDPFDGISRCAQHALAALGEPALDERELRAFIGPPLQENFARRLPPELVGRAIAAYRERFDDVGWHENQVYTAVPEMLDDLGEGGWQMAVATSKLTVFARRIVDHFGLARYFRVVAGTNADDLMPTKAEVIAEVLAVTQVSSEEAVMIGDRSHDVVGALANGVRAVGVGWGYAEPGELERAGAEYVADDPADLAGYLSL